jgi:hypothetical protein
MEENFSPQESLQLIQSMIDRTKANIGESRFYFLLWGWIAFIGVMGQFILKVMVHYPYHYRIWVITLVGIIWSMLYTRNRHKKVRARTYIGDSMRYLWTGMGISFFVLCFIISQSRVGWEYSYPLFILLYGLGTYVSGRILQFKPLVIGGIFNWILAIASTFFDFDYQMLFSGAAILTSYIIPGYLFPSPTHTKK